MDPPWPRELYLVVNPHRASFIRLRTKGRPESRKASIRRRIMPCRAREKDTSGGLGRRRAHRAGRGWPGRHPDRGAGCVAGRYEGGLLRGVRRSQRAVERDARYLGAGSVDDVISGIENTDDEPRTKLRHLFELARDRSGAVAARCAVELAIRDVGPPQPRRQRTLHRVDDRRMAYLRTLFRRSASTTTTPRRAVPGAVAVRRQQPDHRRARSPFAT